MPSPEEIAGFRSAHHLPGLVLTVVDGETVHVFDSGQADLDRDSPVSAETLFRTGSWTKLLTAIAALQLQERGIVALEERIDRWLPELSSTTWAHQTHLRHLLAHASGLPRGPYRSRPWTELELLELAGRCEPVAAAGRVRKYSNLGFAITSVLLGRAAECSLEAWIETNILRPLGLESSYLDLEASASDRATGYEAGHYRSLVDSIESLQPATERAEMPGAGGLLTSGKDLGNLLCALLTRTPRLLTKESWDELFTEQPPADRAPFGLGLRIRQRWGRRFFWHSGGAAGFSTFWSLCPESKVAAAAMTNRCGAETLLSRLLDQVLRPRLPSAELRPRPKPISPHPPSPRLHIYAGRYRVSGQEVRIVREGPGLVLHGNESQVALRPWRRHSFFLERGLGGGIEAGHLLRFREEQGLVFEGFLGPWQLVRSSPFAFLFQHRLRPPRRLLTPKTRACVGTYEHPDVGPVEVFLRPWGLVFSFSFAEESPLEPLGGVRYRIRGGTFAGEVARFRFSGGLPIALEAGLLRFERQPEAAVRRPPRW